MEQMFKEYASWRSKLEQIENKMKQEVEYWKGTCDGLQRDNEKMQKDLLKQTKDSMSRAREMAEKEEEI